MKLKSLFLFSLIFVGFAQLPAQKRVVLDNYYNNEFDSSTGKPFHYLWNDTAMSGFSQFGKLFKAQKAVLSILRIKPTSKNLKNADVYIIVDPDTKLETVNPNFMDKRASEAIAQWVKKGGVLLLLTNDSAHAELGKFNRLAEIFGMKFGNQVLHPEMSIPGQTRNFNSCASTNLPNHQLFKDVRKIFLKEIAPIYCSASAKPILTENGNVLMAEANYGNGYMLAVGDPWLYNEYIDHLLLPADFENMKAAKNLVELLLSK
ncbi:MAG: hypothetical protein GZ091_02675 [Paludibacter sp.]|nr:hypothetical protein [Paludibacter sp.]